MRPQPSPGFTPCEKCSKLRITGDAFLKPVPADLSGKIVDTLCTKNLGVLGELTSKFFAAGLTDDEPLVCGVFLWDITWLST